MTDINPTPRDADADLAICNAATPGPWFADGGGMCVGVSQGTCPQDRGVSIVDDTTTPNAKLIAASREALPYWIAEAKRLRAIVPFTNSEMVFADGREPTTNERHLFNLLTWREHEAKVLKEEIARLRDLNGKQALELADLRSREVIEHGGIFYAPRAMPDGAWKWFDASDGFDTYTGHENLTRELYVALPGVNLQKFVMGYPTREAALQALRDAIEVARKGEQQP